MIAIRSLVVSVRYGDLLRETLWRNSRHFVETLVVTTPEDAETLSAVAGCPSARAHETRVFYDGGARFNKGAAVEAAFDILGRSGWILVWDADILLPDALTLENLDREFLYSCPRRILENPGRWRPGMAWDGIPLGEDRSYPGYFHLFHADAAALSVRPWYDPGFTHAGGCDARFETLWGRNKRKWPMEVLHLGPRDTNWCGRASPRLDGTPDPQAAGRAADMELLRRSKGWGRPKTSEHFDERVKRG